MYKIVKNQLKKYFYLPSPKTVLKLIKDINILRRFNIEHSQNEN